MVLLLSGLSVEESLDAFRVPLQQFGKQTRLVRHQRPQPIRVSAWVKQTLGVVGVHVCTGAHPGAALVFALYLQFIHQVAGQKVSGEPLHTEFLAALGTSRMLGRPLRNASQTKDVLAGEPLRVGEDFSANGAVQMLRYGVRADEGASGGHSMIIAADEAERPLQLQYGKAICVKFC